MFEESRHLLAIFLRLSKDNLIRQNKCKHGQFKDSSRETGSPLRHKHAVGKPVDIIKFGVP
jgi:hypothetical protein